MKKIIHIIDGLGIGGAERMLVDLVTRLDSSHYDILVVWLTPEQDALVPVLHRAGIRTLCVAKKSKIGLQLYRDLRKLCAAEKPDIVHTHLFASDVWGTIAALDAGVPYVVSTEHNINRAEGKVKHMLKTYVRKQQHAIAAVSGAVRNAIIRESGERIAPRVSVIYNAITIERFFSTTKRQNPRPVIAVVGRLTEQKGHMQLLRAMRLVHSAYDMRIVGSGELREKIVKRISELGLGNRIHVEAARPDIERVYQQADIVVVPSQWEGFGLVAAEAMASGCAVIASNVDGLPEVVTHGVTGLLVDMRHREQLAQAIDGLIAFPEQRLRLAAAGKAFVTEHFAMRTMVNAYRHLYATLYDHPTR